MNKVQPYSVLFVCLGNICRSPVAAGVFRSLAVQAGREKQFYIESCGTSNYNAGAQAHPETRRVASERGIILEQHRARQIKNTDLEQFDLLVAMDTANKNDIEQRINAVKNKLAVKSSLILLREHDPEAYGDFDVPDPFYESGFEGVHDIIERSCRALLKVL